MQDWSQDQRTQATQGSGYVRRPRVVYAQNRQQQDDNWQNPGKQPLGRTDELQQQYDRSAYHQPTGGMTSEMPKGKKPRKKRKHRALYATVILLCLLGIGALALFAAPQLLGVTWSEMPN